MTRPWSAILDAKITAIRYGSVQITVHDGRVVQIDATERTRIDDGTSHHQPTGTTGGVNHPPHAGATEPSEFLPRRQARQRNLRCDRTHGSDSP